MYWIDFSQLPAWMDLSLKINAELVIQKNNGNMTTYIWVHFAGKYFHTYEFIAFSMTFKG